MGLPMEVSIKRKFSVNCSSPNVTLKNFRNRSVMSSSNQSPSKIGMILSSSAGNHQLYNAKFYSDNNAAILIEEKELKNNIIENSILKLFKNKKESNSMGQNASELAIKDSKMKIINQVDKLIKL